MLPCVRVGACRAGTRAGAGRAAGALRAGAALLLVGHGAPGWPGCIQHMLSFHSYSGIKLASPHADGMKVARHAPFLMNDKYI